ncbi:MAG: GMC oxidoreductase [Saprospiraceae bacterium]
MAVNFEYDYIIIGSGFGGSVSALRLSQKGYKVLVIEKGKWFKDVHMFPKSNWNLKKWLWYPRIGWNGILNITIMRHLIALSGVGVGGGSLVYANTLPVPKSPFFKSGSWSKLMDWEKVLMPYYAIAKQMLGSNVNPHQSVSDDVMQALATRLGSEHAFARTEVAVHFGSKESKINTNDQNTDAPAMNPCCLCGGCMLGCRYNSKNTLDKNYLYQAQKLGVEILAENLVTNVEPISSEHTHGYKVTTKTVTGLSKSRKKFTSKGVIFSGGVLGTIPLLLKLKKSTLPKISDMIGSGIRSNSENLIGVTSFEKDADFTKGIAIGSIVTVDESRHVEPVRFPAGSGFWRIFMAPMTSGSTLIMRIFNILKDLIIHPISNAKAFFIDDWSKKTIILLYMESIESTLKVQWSKYFGLSSRSEKGRPPTAFNPIAKDVAKKVEAIVNGKAMVLISESLFGIPTTAHILGGACMGKDHSEGVIDAQCNVFGYENMKICDGSFISANIGVNPSLTITAITEYAMSKVPNKSDLTH